MPDFSKLTDRQKEIYDFIREKIETRGYGPTVREIGTAFGIKSPNGVMCHLKALVAKGLILRDKNKDGGGLARAIRLAGYHGPSQGLALLGSVAAGSPTAAIEQADERLNVNELFDNRRDFALKVRGQSMIEDHIDDGDYVVIRGQKEAANGERVVAMIDGDVTLKRFYKERDHIRLEPANGTMKPIIVPANEKPEILGVLVGVIRKC